MNHLPQKIWRRVLWGETISCGRFSPSLLLLNLLTSGFGVERVCNKKGRSTILCCASCHERHLSPGKEKSLLSKGAYSESKGHFLYVRYIFLEIYFHEWGACTQNWEKYWQHFLFCLQVYILGVNHSIASDWIVRDWSKIIPNHFCIIRCFRICFEMKHAFSIEVYFHESIQWIKLEIKS